MDTTLTTPSGTSGWPAASPSLVAAAALAVANFAGEGGSGGAGAYVFGVALVAVLSLVLLGRVLPAAGNPARAGWILAVLALASCVVFWSGLPFALGFGGRLQRRPRRPRRPRRASACSRSPPRSCGCFIG